MDQQNGTPYSLQVVRALIVIVIVVCLIEANDFANDSVDKSEFVATNEWQVIKEGQIVPSGLHYRMNLATGVKEAKLLETNQRKASLFDHNLKEKEMELRGFDEDGRASCRDVYPKKYMNNCKLKCSGLKNKCSKTWGSVFKGSKNSKCRRNIAKYLKQKVNKWCAVSCKTCVNGMWGSWGSYSTCTKSCGIGTQTRSRKCNNPAPVGVGSACTGESKETSNCNIQPCPIEGNWGSWGNWTCSECSSSGLQTRTRFCDNPIPEHEGAHCEYSNDTSTTTYSNGITENGTQTEVESRPCKNEPCPGPQYTITSELVINGISNISLIDSNLTSAISKVLNISEDAIEIKTQEQYLGNDDNNNNEIPNDNNPWNDYEYDMMGRAEIESVMVNLIIKIPHDKDLVIQIELLLSTSFIGELNTAIDNDTRLANIDVISVSGSTTKVCFELNEEIGDNVDKI